LGAIKHQRSPPDKLTNIQSRPGIVRPTYGYAYYCGKV